MVLRLVFLWSLKGFGRLEAIASLDAYQIIKYQNPTKTYHFFITSFPKNLRKRVSKSGVLRTIAWVGDKSQIYMKITLIYLVFCIVYHLFWAFLCLFLSCRWRASGKIEERAKSSKKKSKKARLGKSWKHAAAWFCHAVTWGLSVKKPRLACCSMPHSCRSMPNHVRHDDANRIMLFLASGVLGLLCNTTFFASIKRK